MKLILHITSVPIVNVLFTSSVLFLVLMNQTTTSTIPSVTTTITSSTIKIAARIPEFSPGDAVICSSDEVVDSPNSVEVGCSVVKPEGSVTSAVESVNTGVTCPEGFTTIK